MKILALKSENVKRIEAVEITPDGNLVIVAGANEQGKSSVLDSILYALAGKDALPQLPVREGQDKATIELDLGEYKVKRTITATGGGTLTVRNRENIAVGSPQTLLDKLYGKLTFDPLDFRNQKPVQRVETLRSLLGLNFSEIDASYAKTFAERTVVNRDAGELAARLKAMPEYPDVAPIPTSVDSILRDQQNALNHNDKNRRARSEADQADWEVKDLGQKVNAVLKEIEDLEAKIAACKKALAPLRSNYDSAQEKAKILRESVNQLKDIPLDQFATRLQMVEQENAKVQANADREDVENQLRAKEQHSNLLTVNLKEFDDLKRKRMDEAKWPISGLSLHNGKEVRFNDIPFEQCSTAQQIKISVAMGIAMNPTLRILLIRQGNDLDARNLKLVSEMAEEYDTQIWLERVSTDGDVAVVIEDGRVLSETLVH